ncbi:hypothetical protein J6590_039155 [Homalodisca vitripennis]|nr:hypothetical protein J6590_039155 [Homalodisca vitripennis]
MLLAAPVFNASPPDISRLERADEGLKGPKYLPRAFEGCTFPKLSVFLYRVQFFFTLRPVTRLIR